MHRFSKIWAHFTSNGSQNGKNNKMLYDLQVLLFSVHMDRIIARTVNRKILFVCLLDHELPDTLGVVKTVQTQNIMQTEFSDSRP